MHPFARRLETKRRDLGMNNFDFAHHLGIHHGSWSRVQRGLANPGGELITKAVAKYPELAMFLALDLQREKIPFADSENIDRADGEKVGAA